MDTKIQHDIELARKLFDHIEADCAVHDIDTAQANYHRLSELMGHFGGVAQDQKDKITEAARKKIEQIVMLKIDSLIDHATKSQTHGDPKSCFAFLQILDELLFKSKKIILDNDYLAVVVKRIETIRSMNSVGDLIEESVNSKNSDEGVAKVTRKAERRRYIRYAAPQNMTVQLEGKSHSFPIRNLSMEGLLVEGKFDHIAEGKKYNFELKLLFEEQDRAVTHKFSGRIVKILDNSVALSFEQLKGPILKLVKGRELDLSHLRPLN